jgi:flagellar hook protein FlgE
MGVFGAMITAVSGIRSQSYALENISGNIANSQTIGFKRVDTSFVDLVPDRPTNLETAGSVLAFSRSTNTIQGDLQTTGIGTNIALNGEGYFVIAERTGTNGDLPAFSSQDLYTRRGDFQLDKSGYLVNGAGYYLKGASIDPTTGATTSSANGVIRVSADQLPARQSSYVEYRGNLPSLPVTDASTQAGTPKSEMIHPANYAVDPLTTGTVQAANDSTFISETMSAGSVTIYNNVGAPVNVQMRWAKVSADEYLPGTFSSAEDTWALFYQSDPAATGATVKWSRIGGDFTFSSGGQLTSAASIIQNITVGGTAVTGVAFNFPSLTQFADANGQVSVTGIRQDGYTAGELQNISISADGRVVGTYSNGQVAPLAQIGIAQFQADNALKRRDGGVLEQTLDSGQPIIGAQGTRLIGGSVENSNTDIAEEFSKMIITQQAYSANTRVITTAQQMLQDTINIVR